MTIVMIVIIDGEGDDYKRLYKSRVETYIFSNNIALGHQTLKKQARAWVRGYEAVP